MTAYHQIFIHSEQPVATLLADLSVACGQQLAKAPGDPADYAVNLGHAALELELHHDFEEDHGIPFENYEVLATIRDYARDGERQEQVARRIFESLAATGRYSLALVFNLQELLASHPSLS